MKFIAEKIDVGSLELKDQVVSINRVTKVVKGGKNLSFSALVVVGDGAGHVGYGMGKAREVSSAIKKGVEAAKKNVVACRSRRRAPRSPTRSPGEFGSGMVLLKPASEGTGVIAGGAVRAVITAAGIQNILTKSLGSTTAHNVVKATVDALLRLKAPQRVASLRGRAARGDPRHRGEAREGGRAGPGRGGCAPVTPAGEPAAEPPAPPGRKETIEPWPRPEGGEGRRDRQGQDDRQRHRLHRGPAGHRARAGPAPHAAGGRARRTRRWSGA